MKKNDSDKVNSIINIIAMKINNLSLLTCLLAGVLGVFPLVFSADAMSAQAELKRQGFNTANCSISTMDIRFKLEAVSGEAVVTSQAEWQSADNTADDCLLGNTQVWIKARTEFDQVRYVKVRPDFVSAGAGFGKSTTETPSWGVLFCDQPSDGANCESAENARRLISSNLQFEGFDVVTEQLAVTTLGRQKTLNQAARRTDVGLDSLLSDAIDNAITPNNGNGSGSTPSRRQSDGEAVVSSIVSLISSSLAEYQSPPHSCETPRTVANWVQARNTCELNFKSESSHNYICTDSGQPKRIRATRSANVDFAKDIKNIADIRRQEGQFATLVLEFNDDLQSTIEGDYQTSRWHITAADAQLDDLKKLASHLVSLRRYCESNAS